MIGPYLLIAATLILKTLITEKLIVLGNLGNAEYDDKAPMVFAC